MVPDRVALADDDSLPLGHRELREPRDLDGEPVEETGPDAVDGRRHDDVRFDPDLARRVDDRDVGRALTVGVAGVARLLVGVDVLFVGEDAGFVVFARDGVVAEVGGSGGLIVYFC